MYHWALRICCTSLHISSHSADCRIINIFSLLIKTADELFLILVFVTSNRAIELSSITLSYSIPTRCRTSTHDCATFACTNEKSPRFPSLISSHLLMTISPTFKSHYCCARSRSSSRKLRDRLCGAMRDLSQFKDLFTVGLWLQIQTPMCGRGF